MHSLRKYLPTALFAAFLFIGLTLFFTSRPADKNKRVYTIVKEYSPYYIEKTLMGLRIKNKEDKNFKEEPTNQDFFKEYEKLEQKWAQKHLQLSGNILHILDKNRKELKKVKLQNQKELDFVKDYYKVK
jgi:hypothetical protein